VAVTVTGGWPESRTVGVMEIVAVGSGLTVTETGMENTVFGVLELSFTSSSKFHTPTVDRVAVGVLG
jgi:hypothetical protein